jgi:hypothetical protein
MSSVRENKSSVRLAVSVRPGSECLLMRFYDRQWERHSRELPSPFVDATASARRTSRMPIRTGTSANTRSKTIHHSDVGEALLVACL